MKFPGNFEKQNFKIQNFTRGENPEEEILDVF